MCAETKKLDSRFNQCERCDTNERWWERHAFLCAEHLQPVKGGSHDSLCVCARVPTDARRIRMGSDVKMKREDISIWFMDARKCNHLFNPKALSSNACIASPSSSADLPV